jgi:maltose-binding protein MalE
MAHHKFLEQASSGTLADIKFMAHHKFLEHASSGTLADIKFMD